MQLGVKLVGSLQQYMQEEIIKTEVAVTRGMRISGDRLKNTLRQQVRSTGVKNANRLANTWRSETYPGKGKKSADAAAVVFTKAPKIMEAWNRSGTISVKRKQYMAVPTQNVPRSYIAGRGRSDKRITPAIYERRSGKKLFALKTRNGELILAIRGTRTKTGKFRKGLPFVVMFVLVKQVRASKRINVRGAVTKVQAQVPSIILAEFKRLDSQNSGRLAA